KFSDYSLSELENMLKQVLAKEDYESASKIRDAIKKKE
ncbi:MAG: UvrB/UvrC motif-containing protein, partial [Bacteroidota bacterium]